ncbi:hypothetical protein [Polyangium sp. 6x1]|uniref:hypothetical protein n=1 Tax=Polyangium sp. 6x1 TaxID=3042689 RepID=UPI002482F998|nr:hypothetical protein [Polyangium sp. 6x1]MDI1444364.1 hypothetical protein [Polyangium sp. 6x1]
MRRRSLGLGWLVMFAAITAYACGGGGETPTGAGGGGTGAAGPGGAGGGAPDAGEDGLFVDHGPVVSLTVDPPSSVIVVQNGVATPVDFKAIATFQDQTTAIVSADWTFDRPDVALVGLDTGKLSPTGTVGGMGKVTASSNGLTASADVTVKLAFVDNAGGLTPEEQAAFDAPDPGPSGAIVYPYDKTVFARGILAPEIMWNGGAAGDAWLVHLQQSYVDAKFYVKADPPSGFLMAEDFWGKLAASNAGEPVQVSVSRLSGGKAYAPASQTWSIAQGSLRGSIYYWAVNTGQLMKISPGSANPSVVFDSGSYDQLGTPPPPDYDQYQPPWSQGVNNKRCVACHVVSKDGSRLAAVFERKGQAPSPWGTIDLTQTEPQVIQVSSYNSQTLFVALTPDGKIAVQNDVDLRMRMKDATTGAPIASELDAIGDKTADPAFSPDGKLLAFSSNVTGSYPVEFSRADLDVFDFDAGTNALANRRQIVAAGNLAIAFPSFSPDSQWILYQKGDYSRAKYGANQVGLNDLYMADVAKALGELPLDAANGVGYLDEKNRRINYQPTVNPIAVGGYMWVVFVSPRDYGNRMVSASNPTYENRKQLWVAAIDVNPTPGKDPSHPAFLLRGQDLSTINMSGYWSLEACKGEGNSCAQGFECCTGFCQPDGGGNYACVPPPAGKCSEIGEKCTTGADCCGTPQNQCIGGFCAQSQPK